MIRIRGEIENLKCKWLVSNDLAANDANGSDCHLPPLPPLEMPTFDFDKRNEAWFVTYAVCNN